MKKKSALTISDRILIIISGITALLVILKSTSVIEWSWWFIFSPLLAPVALIFLFLLAWQLFNLIDAMLDNE